MGYPSLWTLDLPVNAAYFASGLAFGPLLETRPVDVVSTSCFAPDYLFIFGLEFSEADGAIA